VGAVFLFSLEFIKSLCYNNKKYAGVIKIKYIVATDFDGTLCQSYPDGYRINDKTLEAIKDFRKEGNLFGVVTGRSYIWAYPVFKELNTFEFDYIISDNGAQCFDKDGGLVFSNKIKAYNGFAKDYVNTVLGFSDEVEEAGICFEKDRFNFENNNPEGNGGYYSKYSVLDELFEKDEFVMVNAVCKNDEAASMLKDEIVLKFGEYLDPAQNGRCLDITAKGINKASGIGQYAKAMGVPYDNIYSAGDNYNDLPMVKDFHGCAVRGAVEALKAEAEFVLDDIGSLIEIILQKEKENG